jgi:hypothetical protein
MGDLGEDLGFAAEPLGVPDQRLMKDLDRDEAAGQPIPRAEHLAHPAGPDETLDDEPVGDDSLH